MTEMVETKSLAKSFGSIKAVDHLTFSVQKGEVLGFLGPNGAGKSTTMKILSCFLAPDSGTAKVCGHDILEDSLAVRQAIGYLPESVPAYPEMTVQGFLEFVGRMRDMHGARLRQSVDAVIEKCNIQGVRHQTFETLSKGYKRRTCLAQALIHDPPVLIMDEPTDGLDPNQKYEVRKLIAAMASEKCIILSTHILEEVEAVCTRAVIIAQGKLVADLSPAEMRERSWRHGAVTLVLKDMDEGTAFEGLGLLEGVDRVEKISLDGRRALRVIPQSGKKIAARVTELVHEKNWSVDEFHVERGQLDEVFREMTMNGGQRS